jgi:hypothetical protein
LLRGTVHKQVVTLVSPIAFPFQFLLTNLEARWNVVRESDA